MIVQKKNGKRIRAYQLGTGSAMEKQMISEGKIIACVDGSYELFSREARQQGEKACAGDYFKIDSAGYPYPNKRDWFCRNHILLQEPDLYEQLPVQLKAWELSEPESEEIIWLKKQGILWIQEEANYFSARLWGTVERTAKDSVILFFHVERDSAGQITEVDFNFVSREEFQNSYRVISC